MDQPLGAMPITVPEELCSVKQGVLEVRCILRLQTFES